MNAVDVSVVLEMTCNSIDPVSVPLFIALKAEAIVA
jgi:hypothetical protein